MMIFKDGKFKTKKEKNKIMTKALLVTPEGTVAEVPFDGLEDLQRLVDGYIEAIMFTKTNHFAYINEDGKLLNLPVNSRATQIACNYGFQFNNGDYISGNMVIVGQADEHGYETDVSQNLINEIRSAK